MKSLRKKVLSLSVFMPAAAGCTNCRTKYNLLTREVGCPSCGLSFCKKCLGYKTRSPRQGNQLVPVCYECYQRGEEAKLKNPALPVQTVSSNKETTGNAVISNWWGEGLPPPSLRQQLGTNPAPSKKVTAPVLPHQSQSNPPQNSKINFEKELGDRLTELKDEGRSEQLPSISNLEERLAALRGCDVELVRNPRLWFSNNEPTINAESSDALIEQAQGLAMIEEKYDLDKALIERVNKLHEKDQTMKTDVSNCPDPRFSTVSDADSLMMNAEERTQFEKILNEAEEENKKILARKENVDEELKDVMKITKQRSEELQKIQTEFTKFWDKQIHKTIEDDSENDEDIDDEMLKKIMKEAEETPDIPDEKGKTQQNESSPKKGFLRNFFKK